MSFAKQETFNIVAKHLLTQNCKAVSNGLCKYRGDNGTKCAAGVLIPDELYERKFEGLSVAAGSTWEVGSPRAVMDVHKVFKKLGHDIELVQDLQRVHDREEVNCWKRALQVVATKHCLSSEVLDETVEGKTENGNVN